jgi:hypothetical protein
MSLFPLGTARVELAIRLIVPTHFLVTGFVDGGLFHGLCHVGKDCLCLKSLTRTYTG